jgi:hypothetical protein
LFIVTKQAGPSTFSELRLLAVSDRWTGGPQSSTSCCGTVTVVLPLKIHGYSLGMPNPGLMPTVRERTAADEAITTTVRLLRRADVDVAGQIVVTRHAHRAITRIVRRRGASRVLLEDSTAGRLRRFLEGDLRTQLVPGA